MKKAHSKSEKKENQDSPPVDYSISRKKYISFSTRKVLGLIKARNLRGLQALHAGYLSITSKFDENLLVIAIRLFSKESGKQFTNTENEIIDFLIEKCPIITMPDRDGITAFGESIIQRNHKLTFNLLNSGFCVNQHNGLSPLRVALSNANYQASLQLLSKGAMFFPRNKKTSLEFVFETLSEPLEYCEQMSRYLP